MKLIPILLLVSQVFPCWSPPFNKLGGTRFPNRFRNIHHHQRKLCPKSPVFSFIASSLLTVTCQCCPKPCSSQQLSPLVSSRPCAVCAVIGILWICLHCPDKIVSTPWLQADTQQESSAAKAQARQSLAQESNTLISLLHLQSLIFAESDNGNFYAGTKTSQSDRDPAFNTSAEPLWSLVSVPGPGADSPCCPRGCHLSAQHGPHSSHMALMWNNSSIQQQHAPDY